MKESFIKAVQSAMNKAVLMRAPLRGHMYAGSFTYKDQLYAFGTIPDMCVVAVMWQQKNAPTHFLRFEHHYEGDVSTIVITGAY